MRTEATAAKRLRVAPPEAGGFSQNPSRDQWARGKIYKRHWRVVGFAVFISSLDFFIL